VVNFTIKLWFYVRPHALHDYRLITQTEQYMWNLTESKWPWNIQNSYSIFEVYAKQ